MPNYDLPEYPEAELAEARRLNRLLRYAPRFRRPSPFGRFFIQSAMRAREAMADISVAGVRIAKRRVEWKGQTFNLRILTSEEPVRGVYIDWHGGGWAIGCAAMDDEVNVKLAKESGLAVVSVDYGLMPSFTLEQMLAQSQAAADWVFDYAEKGFGARNIFIGGESAGAHLAACTVLRLRRTRPDFNRLRGVVLFYGVYDLDATPSVRSAKGDALVLHGPTMQTGLSGLIEGGGDQRRHPDVSPLYADLKGLPPALFFVGAIDPLIDDSRIMAERWREAGGEAELVIPADAPHAFNRFQTAMARRTNGFVRSWIDDQLARAAAPAGGALKSSVAAE